MTVIIYHQNLQNFNGSSKDAEARRKAYSSAFGRITATHPTRSSMSSSTVSPAVVGLTEVLHKDDQAVSQLLQSMQCPQVKFLAVGTTALSNKKEEEYVAIGVSSDYDVIDYGIVVFTKDTNADYRYPAYVIVRHRLKKSMTFAVAFWHNMYSLKEEKVSSAGSVPIVFKKLREACTKHSITCAAFLGGDFNVEPENRGDYTALSARGEFYNPEWEKHSDDKRKKQIEKGQRALGRPKGTVWSGKIFDYWFCDPRDNINPHPKPYTWPSTMDGGPTHGRLMSDHCAISLLID